MPDTSKAVLTRDEILAFLRDEKASIDSMTPDKDDAENDVTLCVKKDLWKAELRAVRVGLLDLLDKKTKERRTEMYADIPDHPVVQNCERTGYPDGKAPRELLCPVCDESCETVYEDRAGDIVGCEQCLTAKPVVDVIFDDGD